MQSEERLHALDAVRAWALLVGVFFHAALSFVTSYSDELRWAANDSSQSATLLVFVGTSHLFRMTLFFFIAGFFARLVYHRKGPAEFARNRAVRIGIPFAVGLTVMIPLLAVIWMWGYAKQGVTPPPAPESPPGALDLTHLWFLYYLLVFYVLIVGTRHVFADRLDPTQRLRAKVDAWFAHALKYRWAPFAIAVPIALAALVDPAYLGGGMPTPDRSVIPALYAVTGYGAAFTAGWLLHRNAGQLIQLSERTRTWWIGAGVTLILSAGAGWAVSTNRDSEPLAMLSALFSTSFTWFVDFALIGLALKKFSAPSARNRYIADASYWIYIAHLPVVCALQVLVADWPLHWTVKYTFITGVAFTALFASYHYCVRYTFIGTVLNGKKSRDIVPATTVQAV